jgi:hypothetical protein
LFSGEDPAEVAEFFDMATGLGVEGITVSPGYSYHHAPRQDVFLGRRASKELFRGIFSRRKDRPTGVPWSFNHSGLFLDFLAGNQAYQCTPWSNPTYNVFGWQRPCYLLSDEGYADTYKSLIEDTEWDKYGVGKNPRCDNCMAHCGFEGTAVNDAFSHPIKAPLASWKGPRVTGPMAPELPIQYSESARYADANVTVTAIPVAELKRVRRETEDSAAEPR